MDWTNLRRSQSMADYLDAGRYIRSQLDGGAEVPRGWAQRIGAMWDRLHRPEPQQTEPRILLDDSDMLDFPITTGELYREPRLPRFMQTPRVGKFRTDTPAPPARGQRMTSGAARGWFHALDAEDVPVMGQPMGTPAPWRHWMPPPTGMRDAMEYETGRRPFYNAESAGRLFGPGRRIGNTLYPNGVRNYLYDWLAGEAYSNPRGQYPSYILTGLEGFRDPYSGIVQPGGQEWRL